jgi:hypothetical protein
MMKYYISLNQFAEFSKGSIATKKRIIKQQQAPNKFLIQWYQTARSAIKKYLKDINNLTPIDKAIDQLLDKTVQSKRQQSDKTVSIEALQQLKTIAFPSIMKSVDFEIIKIDSKLVQLNGVNIIIAPDVIFKGYFYGQIIYGAVKIHICKYKPFDFGQTQYVSNLIYKYLNKQVPKSQGIVLPELCLCIDIFGGRVTSADAKSQKISTEIKMLCEELKMLWAA